MVRVTIENKAYEYTTPILLSQAIRDAGASFSMPCGGRHTCGKCKVIATGALSEMTAEERKLLSEAEIEDKFRLACFTYAVGETVVTLARAGEEQILTAGEMSSFSLSPLSAGYGLAVDIGTTTVVCYLYKTDHATPLQVISRHNEQSRFGADVISRIGYCNEKGVSALHEAIIQQLNQQITALCRAEQIAPDQIGSAVITGNTTMLHLLYGLDPRGIAVAPFTTQSLFGEEISPKKLGLQLSPDCKLYLPRAISSYVGADITCAILASGMTEQANPCFLVDIGTNGEMALFSNGALKCCSAAAGPAFEGAGIKMGMSALAGAINKVWAEGNQIRYTTIGDQPPIGICGSGIIDAVATFLGCGLIDDTGRIEQTNSNSSALLEAGEELGLSIGDSGIILTQSDIRQIQLAKAAIRAGIDTLLQACGISAEELDTFYIAGGFGSFINKESAAQIGLIPFSVIDRVKVIGNGAGMGATAYLLSTEKLAEGEEIATRADEVELSANPYFMDQYISRMLFESE